ncbi:MAG TPA: hypothetical protein PKD00_01835 [Burkholderiales bacterium]|nr:hypothetical protein [Burkholderiales bacterium]
MPEITLVNIKSFIVGYLRSWIIKLYNNNFKWVEERQQYRLAQVELKSPECLTNGQCKHCGCKTPELFYADKACSNTPPCYPEINSKVDWIEFKIENNIQTAQ